MADRKRKIEYVYDPTLAKTCSCGNTTRSPYRRRETWIDGDGNKMGMSVEISRERYAEALAATPDKEGTE